MSGSTPRLGLVYATPTDPVTNYPALNQQGQTQLDTALSRYLSGVATVSGTNVTDTPTVQINFPAGRYTLAPVVVLQAYGTGLWIACVNSLTATGMKVYASTKTGAPGTVASLQIHWQTTPGQTVRLAGDDGGEDQYEPLPDPIEQDE